MTEITTQTAAPTQAGPQIAQAGPVGTVSNAVGSVTAIRADGTQVTLEQGSPVYLGDTLETRGGARVEVTFDDASVVTLGENGRLTVDTFVYDGGQGTGQMSVEFARGLFAFTSGEIAKTGDDAMELSTPVATIGIRGTSGIGRAAPEGMENYFVLLPDADGTVGEFVVSNAAGSEILTVPLSAVTVTSANTPPSEPQIYTLEQLQSRFPGIVELLTALLDQLDLIEVPTPDPDIPPEGDDQGRLDDETDRDTAFGDDEFSPEELEALAEELSDIETAAGRSFFSNASGLAGVSLDQSGDVDEPSAFLDDLATANAVRLFGGEIPPINLPSFQSGASIDQDPGGSTSSGGSTGGGSASGTGASTLTLGTTGADDIDLGSNGDQSDVIASGGGDDTVSSGGGDDIVLAGSGNDRVLGEAGRDTIFGGSGDDTLEGGDGDDTLFGNGGEILAKSTHSWGVDADLPVFAEFQRFSAEDGVPGSQVDMTMEETQVMSARFITEGAGFANSVGYYTYGEDGTIKTVDFLFADTSIGAWNSTVNHGDTVEFTVGAGDTVGLFVLSNGYRLNDFDLFDDPNGRFEFRDASGNPATIGSEEAHLFFVSTQTDGTGNTTETAVEVNGGVWHSGLDHLNTGGQVGAYAGVNPENGAIRFGFEDRYNADGDYNDVVVDLLAGPADQFTSDNDVLLGGAGNDFLYGEAGDDRLDGGIGDDTLFGGLDNDDLSGGSGSDILYGGTGADIFRFDLLAGNESGDRDVIMDFEGKADRIFLDNLMNGSFDVVQTGRHAFELSVDADGDSTTDLTVAINIVDNGGFDAETHINATAAAAA